MNNDSQAGQSSWPQRLNRIGIGAVAIGVIAAILSGPLNRSGLTGFTPALLLLAIGALMLVVGGLMAASGWALAHTRGLAIERGRTLAAIVLMLGVGGYIGSWLVGSGDVPLLHEISTDLDNPPPFVAIRALREADPANNPSDYVTELPTRNGSINVPEAQRQSYPDIQPLQLALPPAEAFARTEAAIRELGWEMVASVPAEGRIEATDSTFYFGFKDDVVVRIAASASGSRVDVRSKSRVGLGDAGTNARRVRALLAAITKG